MHEKKMKKRKRKQVNDLRSQAPKELVGSKRKERKKQCTKGRKKKQRRNEEQENVDFPAHDGVLVTLFRLPPKLVAVPKRRSSAPRMHHKRDYLYRQLTPIGSGKDGHQGQGFQLPLLLLCPLIVVGLTHKYGFVLSNHACKMGYLSIFCK